jgi:ectoine hydroxylase-related dioxygenase (phytanoyl-CoA dioxygenase family)
MLTPEQLDEFNRRGILHVPGAVPAADAEAMCGCVWDNLGRRYPFRRDRPDTWSSKRVMGFNALDKSVAFEQVGSSAVRAILDSLLGRGNWQRPARWASLLVAFPESPGPWDVPHTSWHIDLPASNALEGLFAVRLFTCLAPLHHGGGGTVMVAGSHLLVEKLVCNSAERLRSADAREALIHAYPWVKALCSRDESEGRVERFMKPGKADRNGLLRVVEMTGEPGDVFLVHPLILHAHATNCAAVPRIVLSSWVYRNGIDPTALYQSK